MRRIFASTRGPEDWRQGLADPEKHWRSGYSAKTLAYCWEDASGFPLEISKLFSESKIHGFEHIELLVALPEYKVELPGGERPSQNDLFVLAKDGNKQLIAIAVEGKVSEPFGPTVGEWSADISEGKAKRLEFLRNQLGLSGATPSDIRYQLLHRTASAVIEACRFNAKSAVMIVHSFSQEDKWFDDYERFVRLFGKSAGIGELIRLGNTQGATLFSAWVKGDKKYLAC